MKPIKQNGKITGSYAWHVSDESMKARVNVLRDPRNTSTMSQKVSLLASSRPNVSVLDGLDFLPQDDNEKNFTASQEILPKLIDLKQFGLLENGKDISKYRHSITPYSNGLLVDVRNGGLKKDLSMMFEAASLPPEYSDRVFNSIVGVTGKSDPYWSALQSYYQTYRMFGDTKNQSLVYTKAPSVVYPMANLKEVEMPKTFYAAPLLAKVDMIFSYQPIGNTGVPKIRDKSYDALMALIFTPRVVLCNPYNVSVSFDEMFVGMRGIPVSFKFFKNGVEVNQFTNIADMT